MSGCIKVHHGDTTVLIHCLHVHTASLSVMIQQRVALVYGWVKAEVLTKLCGLLDAQSPC